MLHRVWRMGQTEDVEIVVLTFAGTVESDIWKAVKYKESISELFMNIKGG
jgi:SNF2 family DNA or RNA helicase